MKAIFAHKQTYSRKGNSKNRSIADICAEAARLEGATPHVENPIPPIIIDGIDPAELPDLIEDRVKTQNIKLRKQRKDEPHRASKIRGIRADTHLLVASVYSYPVQTDEMDDDIYEEYNRWLDDVIAFARDDAERNGLEVMSIVEHLDEAHPHIHVLAVPAATSENPRLNAKACHEGHVAQDQHIAKQAHGSPSRAYKQAMRSWQDRYYEAVGQRHAQARMGPGRRRMSRAAYQSEKALLETMKDCAEIEDTLDRATDTFLMRKKKAEEQIEKQQAEIEVDRQQVVAAAESDRQIMLDALRAQRHALIVQTQQAEVKAIRLQDKINQFDTEKRAHDVEMRALRKNTIRESAQLAVEIIAAVVTGQAGIGESGKQFIKDPELRKRANGLGIGQLTKDAMQAMLDLWAGLKALLNDAEIVEEKTRVEKVVKQVRNDPSNNSGPSPF